MAYVATDLGDLVNFDDVSCVVIKELTEEESDSGELLPPEDVRVYYVGVAVFRSKNPDMIVTFDRLEHSEAKLDVQALLTRITCGTPSS